MQVVAHAALETRLIKGLELSSADRLALEAERTQQAERMQGLCEELESKTKKVLALEEEGRMSQQKVEALEARVQDLRGENTQLQNLTTEMQTSMSELADELAAAEAQVCLG